MPEISIGVDQWKCEKQTDGPHCRVVLSSDDGTTVSAEMLQDAFPAFALSLVKFMNDLGKAQVVRVATFVGETTDDPAVNRLTTRGMNGETVHLLIPRQSWMAVAEAVMSLHAEEAAVQRAERAGQPRQPPKRTNAAEGLQLIPSAQGPSLLVLEHADHRSAISLQPEQMRQLSRQLAEAAAAGPPPVPQTRN